MCLGDWNEAIEGFLGIFGFQPSLTTTGIDRILGSYERLALMKREKKAFERERKGKGKKRRKKKK